MPTAPSIDLTSKPARKLVPLTQAQAYSLLFCQKGTSLYDQLREEWKLYKSADDATLEKYQDVFGSTHNPSMPFVAFQQVILRDKVASATTDELDAIQEFIDTRFKEETELRERPWSVLRVDDVQSEAELERQYIAEYVSSPSHHLIHH